MGKHLESYFQVRSFLCNGRILSMLWDDFYLNALKPTMDMNWEPFEFTENRPSGFTALVQGWRALSRLPASQPGVFLFEPEKPLSPGDWKGTERGKKLSVEKIIQGKEAGKWHNGQGKKEGQRESVTLSWALEKKKETTGETKQLCGDPWSHFFQRIFCCQNKI